MLMTRPKTQAFHHSSSSETSIKPSASTATSLILRRVSSSPIGILSEPSSAATGRNASNPTKTCPAAEPKRHPSMRWDAYVSTPDPDALAVEFAAHGAAFSAPLEVEGPH